MCPFCLPVRHDTINYFDSRAFNFTNSNHIGIMGSIEKEVMVIVPKEESRRDQ